MASLADTVLEAHLHRLQLLGHSEGSVYARRRALIRMQALIPVPLLEASGQDLAAWREQLLELTPASVRGYVSHARSFYDWAIGAGLLEQNPAAALPVPRRPRMLPRPIGAEDLAVALAAAPGRIRPWLVLAAWAGLRAKEIALLRRDHVLDGARPPVLLIAADATKGHAERTVPLSVFVLAEVVPGLPRSGWAFRRHDGGRGPNHPSLISHLANRHLHGCGSPATLHQLRHRFASEAYHASRDLRIVQELLGHRDPATTAGYAAFDRSDARAAVEAIPPPVSRNQKMGCDL